MTAVAVLLGAALLVTAAVFHFHTLWIVGMVLLLLGLVAAARRLGRRPGAPR